MKYFGAAVALSVVLATTAAFAAAQPAWITARNKPCKIWNPEPHANESVTWSGGCEGGFASGKGVLQWSENGKPDAKFEGVYANGKRNGPGVLTAPDGESDQGVWSDDQLVPEDDNSI